MYCLTDDNVKEKTELEELNEMKDEMVKELVKEFQDKPTPNINFLSVKQDQEAFFQLSIQSRHSAKAY